MKGLLFYLQTTSSLNRSLLGFLTPILSVFDVFRLQADGFVCDENLRNIYQSESLRFLFVMLLPLFIYAAICCLFGLRFLVNRWCRRQRAPGDLGLLKQDLALVFLFLLYVSYYELAEEVLGVFRFETLANSTIIFEETPWLVWDLENPEVLQLFVLACVFGIVYIVGVPLLFWFILYKNRSSIISTHRDEELAEHHHDEHNAETAYFEFLHSNYRRKWYYFEVIMMLRRVLLAITLAAVPQESEFVPLLAVTLFVLNDFSLTISLGFNPAWFCICYPSYQTTNARPGEFS